MSRKGRATKGEEDQGRVGQRRARRDKTVQSRVKWAWRGRAARREARQCRAISNKAGQRRARRGDPGQDEEGQLGSAARGRVGQSKTGQGKERPGKVRPRKARESEEVQRMVAQRKNRQSSAMHGRGGR